MQLRKFYGRTVSSALTQVKRELGPDALILETNLLQPGSPAALMNPQARYEVLAARDTRQAAPAAPARPAYVSPRPAPAEAHPLTYSRPAPRPAAPAFTSVTASSPNPQSPIPHSDSPNPQSAIRNPQSHATPSTSSTPPTPAPRPARQGDLLEDLGLLRSQISQLIEGDRDAARTEDFGHRDIAEFHSLIDQGVDHNLLAPHFRTWLDWRTADPSHRAWMGKLQDGPAGRMQGESLREWLWLTWSAAQGLETEAPAVPTRGPQVLALVGATGTGKTTTLAKLASISRHKHRQNSVILTLDTMRFGATEQWRKIGRLMGIDVIEITNSMDVSKAMENWDRYAWVGIDTPGGIHPESATGMLYGSILAQHPSVESVIVLPATQQESVCREQMKRYRGMGARKALFSKMDETTHNGGIINLTMDGTWKIDSFATGCRIPEDWEAASRQSLWRRVLAPQMAQGGVA